MRSFTKCGRCGRTVLTRESELCWYCGMPLCDACWDEWGHCGHPEADEINDKTRAWYRVHGLDGRRQNEKP